MHKMLFVPVFTLMALTLGSCGAAGTPFANPFATAPAPVALPGVTLAPAELTLTPGQTTRIAITADSGASLSVSGQGKLSAVLEGSGGLLINVPADATLGSYAVKVTQTLGDQTGSAVLNVTVQISRSAPSAQVNP